ncbi:MAG: FAD-dependent oxidoreductase [Tannerellaceae bacterium]|jgi:ribulose 1,5-bisphosphate synthetase/thiazole synthase|nr:FAD-dependent oxidoreductase [Tannerellaceae bacterium]
MISRRDFIKITAAGGALVSAGRVAEARAAVQPALPDEGYVWESSRRIPLIADVDLLVVGGSSRGVAAASAAVRTGCNVFLIASLPYLGDDICGAFLYEQAEGEQAQTALARRVFPSEAYPTPLHVKTVLEDELINNGVGFLYCSYVTHAVVDDSGRVAGVTIVNRSGRQAIRCKALIDATQTASVALLFGAQQTPFRAGVRDFLFTVTGNTPTQGDGITKTENLRPLSFGGKTYPLTRYTFSLPLQEPSYAALMQIEHIARTRTWDPDQVDSADLLWFIPEETILCRQSYRGNPASLRKIPEEAFEVRGIGNIWVVGPCADIPRAMAATLMRPLNALFLADVLGERIAGRISGIPTPGQARVLQPKAEGFNYGSVRELLNPLRPLAQKDFIDSPEGALPVWGRYEVVVLGGGTAGASAGISAAGQGAKTIVLEYLHSLGGLMTAGMIGRYWDGFREGFTSRIDKGVREMAPEGHSRQLKDWKNDSLADWKMEWFRRELLQAGGTLWFGVLGCGALVEDGRIKGVVVSTPYGRGVILSDVLIDSTGSADIAIAAGAAFDYTGKHTLAVQGAGLGKADPGDYYNNNDWLFIDDTDILDVSRAFVQAKVKLQGHYDLVKIPQTRERRRILSEHIISVYDVLNHRRYPDTISYHRSSFDTHGMITDPYFILSPPMERHMIYDADVPLRSLLPRGLEGILTTGLGTGAHRDAMPVIRMQACLQNQGYAVGLLAATAVKEGKSLRKVDMKKIQRHLVAMGNLPARVLTDKEFSGFSAREMQEAARSVTDNYKGLEVLLTDPARCSGLLKKRLAEGLEGEEALICASILCMMGDKQYAQHLAGAIAKQAGWDKGWHYTGMGQFGMSLSRLDSLLIALGKSGERTSLPLILEKAGLLEPEDEFSHYRAVTMATESIGSSEAVPLLASLLLAPGVRFHALDSYATARQRTVPDWNDVSTRNIALKELHLAKALYLCGDWDGLAERILRRYADGLQGHYARFAAEILRDVK